MHVASMFAIIAAFFMMARLNAGTEGGIFADFTTSHGTFTCKLEYTAAPLAVANFIGLAEGSRTWIDPATGAIRKAPFYEGLTFHRVIQGFMNQSGSRNGLGNDGPGYSFPDELDNNLFHDGPGVLSMANSGPQTNGSQFFITADATPWLDGIHTVFGSVTDGMPVVVAINTTPTDANSRPLTPVVIDSILIRRIGSAAEAFNIHAQLLPVCRPVPGKLAVKKNSTATFIANQPIADSSIFQGWRSDDLKTWQYLGQIFYAQGALPYSDVILDNAILTRAFYHIAVTDYPMSFPQNNAARTLNIVWDGGLQQLAYEFNPAGDGGIATYTVEQNPQPTAFQLNFYSAEPFRAVWIFTHDDLNPLRITGLLSNQSDTHITGTMTLEVFNLGWNHVANGTFTLTR